MPKSFILLKNKTTPSDPYEEIISSHEHKSHFIPLLNHSHLDKSEIVQHLISSSFVEDTYAFIITSQRAVECFNECISMITDEEIRQKLFNKPGYTVGPATADILAKSGFLDIRGGLHAGNGSILSDIIIDDLSPPTREKKLLFFTGEIRKDIIPKKIKKAGFDLKERVLYRTESRDDIVNNFEECCSNLHPTGDNWLIFFSPQGTETFVEYLVNSENKLNFKVASIGPTTQLYLEENGVVPCVVATKPTAPSLIEVINNYQE
ncbi:uroporphyrinogen-III synthase [[Candida] railenensis]|uniref:Uroporphyrinogen-III synthase n=1 Tax=[Candida] railenensis TaxID=45579 RepID=A0A9P0QQD7_9ASCO|nr:uroporphyrinogen-III synthase [[Candida] railenensis]